MSGKPISSLYEYYDMFVMPVQHGEATTRIKYYEPDGTEVLDKDDPYLFLRYEAADPASSKRKAENVGAYFLWPKPAVASQKSRRQCSAHVQQQMTQ